MKLTKIDLDEHTKAVTVTIEMPATTLYRLNDMVKALAEHGGDFTKLKAVVEMAERLDAIEKEAAKLYEQVKA